MTLPEAYDLIDLLLDKADQPYFTTEEKHKFLGIAISDFVNFHYQKMAADEDSKRALSGHLDWQNYFLSKTEIFDGSMIHPVSNVPTLTQKYGETWHGGLNATGVNSQETTGYWIYTNQYILPPQHLYIISLRVKLYNKEQTIIPADDSTSPGTVFSTVTSENNIQKTDWINVDLIRPKELYSILANEDPFNGDFGIRNQENSGKIKASFTEGRLVFDPPEAIADVTMLSLTLPTVEMAFTDNTWEDSSLTDSKGSFTEHYQRQIIQMAVEKMTRVDIGLMNPSQ
tara:strand:+ start:115 stop:969 length:855 start_codon:yes stop_codon:yes gene_type:complete